MNASIIITTRNRASSLNDTLLALRHVAVPDGLRVELLVVDNGSTDATPSVVNACTFDTISVRYSFEATPGQCWARNRGLSETSGELVLFLDDDVRPARDWLTRMWDCHARSGPCGIAGGVTIAPHFVRPWMTSLHRCWLASSEWLDPLKPHGMIGANMAFSRDVLRDVPRFDVELGPGALGFSDDMLFARQIREAGYRIALCFEARVEHHFQGGRLDRSAWIDAAKKRGESHAYLGHHWMHWGHRMIMPRLLRAKLALATWRLANLSMPFPSEGCTERELQLRYRCALLSAHFRESHRERKYAHKGLVKLTEAATAKPSPAAAPPLARPGTLL